MSYKDVLWEWTGGLTPGIGTKCTAEFLGCMMFHFIGSLSGTAVGNAVALMSIVYFTAKLSGAHLNPALTIMFSMLGHTNPIVLCFYVASQILGAIFGALWLAFLVPGLTLRNDQRIITPDNIAFTEYDGCFRPRTDLSSIQIIIWEAIGTFMFILPIFSVVWYTQHKSGYGTTGPIMVGIALYSSASAVGAFTGAALNPSRVLASYYVFGCVPGFTVGCYIAGEIIGTLCASLFIIPWYGISQEPWYIQYVNNDMQEILTLYQPSIVLKTAGSVAQNHPYSPYSQGSTMAPNSPFNRTSRSPASSAVAGSPNSQFPMERGSPIPMGRIVETA